MMKPTIFLPSFSLFIALLTSPAFASELVLDLSSPLAAGESFKALIESESHAERMAMLGALVEYAEGRLRNFGKTGHASNFETIDDTELNPEQFVENLRPLEGLNRKEILAKFAADITTLKALGEIPPEY